MKRHSPLRALAVAMLATPLAGTPALGQNDEFPIGPDFAAPAGERYVPGEVIVRFRDIPLGAAVELPGTRSPQALSEDTFVFKLEVPLGGPLEGPAAAAQMDDFLAAMREREDVAYAEPNYWAYPVLTPDDTHYSKMWHYFERGGGTGQSLGGVGLPAAWDDGTGDAAIVVAVIDTGILPSHPEFASGNLVDGFDMVSHPQVENDAEPGRDDDETDPGDAVAADECFPGSRARGDSWHGSHVAGTIGAGATNDGAGIAGVAWQVGLLPVRVLGKCGGTTGDIAAAIRWAAGLPVPGVRPNTTPARVINLSLGGPGACTSTYRDAISAAIGAGAAVVVAAGNDSDDAGNHRPSSCADAITVGAVDFRAHLARYSNFGSVVDVMAPGGDVQRDDNGDSFPDGVLSVVQGGYAYYNGTSMAAPHAAGVLALWLAQDPSLSPAELAQRAATNTHPLAASDGCGGNRCGGGLIAAKLAPPTPPPSPPSPPTPPPNGGICGLLGIEVVLLLPIVARAMARRTRREGPDVER